MDGHISFAASDKCWNLEDSYGEICVHCGCCSSNAAVRNKARLETAKQHLEDCRNFNGWATEYPALMEVQKKNLARSIQHYEAQVARYEKLVEKEDAT